MKQFILILLTGFLVIQCGLSRRAATPISSSSSDSNPPKAFSVSKFDEMEVSLMQAYRDWKGTPYRIGGRSANGVDCSSFVSIIFDEYFGRNLPASTRRLLNRGEGVRRHSIRSGDLVFFKTGRRTLHVGILVEEGEFLHASTSQGVTLSSIFDEYWANRYLGARRIM